MKKYEILMVCICIMSIASLSFGALVEDDFNRPNSNDLGTMSDGVHSWYEMEAYAATNQIWSNKVFTSYNKDSLYAAGAAVDNFMLADGSVQVDYLGAVSTGSGRYVGVSYRAANLDDASYLVATTGYNVRVAIDWSGTRDVALYYGTSLVAQKDLTADNVAPDFTLKATFDGNNHNISLVWSGGSGDMDYIETTAGRTMAGYLGFGNYYTTQAEFDNFAVTPEPASLSILGLGALLFARKRKK